MNERGPQYSIEKQNLFLTVLDYGKGIGIFMVGFGVLGLWTGQKEGPVLVLTLGGSLALGSAAIRQVGSGINWSFLLG